jgi:hypothetical protein
VELRKRAQGTDHWHTRGAELFLAKMTRISQLTPEAQAECAAIDRLGTGSDVLRVRQFSAVIENCARRIEVRTRLLGSDDDETAADYMYMGFATWEGENDLAATEQLFRNALATRRRVYRRIVPLWPTTSTTWHVFSSNGATTERRQRSSASL